MEVGISTFLNNECHVRRVASSCSMVPGESAKGGGKGEDGGDEGDAAVALASRILELRSVVHIRRVDSQAKGWALHDVLLENGCCPESEIRAGPEPRLIGGDKDAQASQMPRFPYALLPCCHVAVRRTSGRRS